MRLIRNYYYFQIISSKHSIATLTFQNFTLADLKYAPIIKNIKFAFDINKTNIKIIKDIKI